MARILYFGIARDLAGISDEALTLAQPVDVDGLWAALIERHPQLERIRPVCRVAVDMNYAAPDSEITDGSELAIIPPVAGG